MTQKKYHLFVTYASEDRDYVNKLGGAFEGRGLNVWYDQTEIKVGDVVIDKINDGLSNSSYGVLVLSEHFFKKEWPQYEKKTLMYQYIEDKKLLFPMWHKIDKEGIKKHDPHLAGIFSLKSDLPLRTIVSKVMGQMKDIGKTIAMIPSYEDPVFRFFQGRGELKMAERGEAFTLWEAIVYFKKEDYPLQIGTELYTQDDLLFAASELYYGDWEYVEKELIRDKERARKIREILGKEFI